MTTEAKGKRASPRLTATEADRRLGEVLRIVATAGSGPPERPVAAAELIRLVEPFVGLN